jgi:hypothetical protein
MQPLYICVFVYQLMMHSDSTLLISSPLSILMKMKCSDANELLRTFQSIARFSISRYTTFIMYLDISCRCIAKKNYVPRNTKLKGL